MNQKIGLFVIDKCTNQTIILKRSTPYNDSICTPQDGFVEEYCIPRGGLKHENETDLECGIREFIEECQIFFSEFYILPETFNLQWRDPPNKLWKYKILFLFVSMKNSFPIQPFNVRIISDKICSMIRNINYNSFYKISDCEECFLKYKIPCIKTIMAHVEIPQHLIDMATNNYMKINNVPENLQRQILNSKNVSSLIENHKFLKPFRKDIKKIQGIRRENIYKIVMVLQNYYTLMNTRLKLYSESNYLDFFKFIDNILVTYKI